MKILQAAILHGTAMEECYTATAKMANQQGVDPTKSMNIAENRGMTRVAGNRSQLQITLRSSSQQPGDESRYLGTYNDNTRGAARFLADQSLCSFH
jgi:hypothetical protein